MSYVTDRITNCITCGGELQANGRGIPTCPYCGRQYKQGVDGFAQELEEIVKRRQLREFIQAEELCRELLLKQPESSEVYWQTVLSSLGVVYVVDPETEKAKPTFFSYAYDDRDTIENNKDYQKALKYAESREERAYYVTQAQELDRLLKEFFSLVAKEASYDIFISFKRTTKAIVNGEAREIDTDDYKKAEEIYSYFSKKYKVFFSPVSIGEDTGIEGEKYEPRILKALQTSQAMILLGSRKEYIEAQWVQNEWKRYQYFIKKGKKQKNSLVFAYEKNLPALPPALKDIQLPSVDWYKASYLKELESKLSFVKTSKGIQSKIKERKIVSDFDTVDDFEFQGKGDRVIIGKKDGVTIEISASEKRELDTAFVALEGKHFKDAAFFFSEILKRNTASYKAYWGRFRTNILANKENAISSQIAMRGNEDIFKDAASAIEYSTDEAFSWSIVDYFIEAIKCAKSSSNKEVAWSKMLLILNFVIKYLDDDRIVRVRSIIKDYVSSCLLWDKIALAEQIFCESRRLYFEEDRKELIAQIEEFADALFKKNEYDSAAKYYGELASGLKTSIAYWKLLCCRLKTQDAAQVPIVFEDKADTSSQQKKSSELSLQELIERTIVCWHKEYEEGSSPKKKKNASHFNTQEKVEELVLYQIVKNKKWAESVIEEVANCYLQLNDIAIANELFMRVAERYIQLKDFKHAKKYYNEVLSRDQNCSKAHWGLVLCRFKVQDERDLCKKSTSLMQTPEFINAKNCATDEEFRHYTSIYNGDVPFFDSPYKRSKKRADGKVPDPNRQAYLHFTKGKRAVRGFAIFLLIVFIASLVAYGFWAVTNPVSYESAGYNTYAVSHANYITRSFLSKIEIDKNGTYAVSEIENKVFKGSKLKTVTLGSSVTKIGEEAFCGCKSLEKVIIKGNDVTVGARAFADCPKLKDIVFEGTGVSIQQEAFTNTAIASIELSGVTYLGANAFSGNSTLKEIILECDESVTVDSKAFKGLASDAKVYIPSVVPQLVEQIKSKDSSVSIETYTENAEEECVFFINQIGEVSLNSAEAIEKAESLYAALTAPQKEDVFNYDVLTKARKVYDTMTLIADIGEVSLDSKNAIEQAESSYSLLSKSLKSNISNYSVLASARRMYDVMLSISMIGEITTQSEPTIQAIENAYNALSEEEKRGIKNHEDLQAARTAYENLWSFLSTKSNLLEAGTYTKQTSAKTAIGNSVTLSAATNPGYTWLGWYDGETKVSEGASPTYTFAMPAQNKTYMAKWILCPITLEKNSAEAGTVSGISGATAIGADVTITAVTNNGYTWLGWYDDDIKVSDGTSLTYTFAMPAENKTFTAKWIKVSLEKNEEDAGIISSLTDTYVASEEVSITAETNPGYTWLGWYDGETKVSEGDNLSYKLIMPTENKIYTAKWAAYTLTTVGVLDGEILNTSAVLSFDINGGSSGKPDDQIITSSKGMIYPSTIPMRSGYSFSGWYTTSACMSLFDFSKDIAEDTTVYAGWNAMAEDTSTHYSRQYIDVVGKYHDEEHSCSVSLPTSTTSGMYTYFTVFASGFYTLEFTFSDYSCYLYVSSSRNGTIFAEKQMDVGDRPVIGFTASAGEVICIRNRIKYTLYHTTCSFYIKGSKYPVADGKYKTPGSFTMKDAEKVTAGSSVSLTATTNPSYTWLGWYDGDRKVSDDVSLNYDFEMPTGNKTYTAKWLSCSVVLTKNILEAGEISSLTDAYVVGENITVSAELKSTNLGYVWLGWYDGETIVSEGTNLTYTFPLPAKNKTLTAKWMLSPITLEKNIPQAGTVDYVSGGTIVGSSATITASTNLGYTWLGWYDGETKVSEGASLTYTFAMPAENKTFTAKWIKVSLGMNNDEAGAISSLTEAYVVGEEVNVSAETNPGYTWLGWYDGETKVSEGASLTYTFAMPAENKTFTAKWIKVFLEKNEEDAGIISSLTDTYVAGEEVSITADTNPGYTWLGWYDGETKVSEGTSLTYIFMMPETDILYSAKWEITQYSITYNLDGGVNSIANPNKYTKEQCVMLSAPIKTTQESSSTTSFENGVYYNIRNYITYTFIGWYTESTFENNVTAVTFGMGDVTLFAKWSETTTTSNTELPYLREGSTIYFGRYPQSEISDTEIVNALNTAAGALPTENNSRNWTSYGYYIYNTRVSNYMWYIDVSYKSEKYRGVYFISYRPYYTTNSSFAVDSYQGENGYNTSTVYWFKYEPIKWSILSEANGEALILCEMIIDSQEYYSDISSDESSFYHNGWIGYANNYELSNIRKWLNDTFYNTAFTDLQKQLILLTTVDNSARSTNPNNNATQWNSGYNSFACSNTNDHIFLLSEQEVTNFNYGFSSDYNEWYNSGRRKKPTDYAKSQGVWGNSNTDDCFWWLRSPKHNWANYVRWVDSSGRTDYSVGYDVRCNCVGVVPALRIRL